MKTLPYGLAKLTLAKLSPTLAGALASPLAQLALIALLLMPAPAYAGFGEAKTMRSPLSSREVERPILMPKGWLEFGLGADIKQASGYWDADGDAVDFEQASWLYSREYLNLRFGISTRSELYWHLPVHYLRLTNETLGTDTSGLYLGDPRFGWLFQVFSTDSPRTSVVTRLEFKAPAGNESPGSYIAGPSTFQSFVTTTGTPDLKIGADAKRQFGLFAVHGAAAYVYRFSGLAVYLLETENNQFVGRIKPGAQVQLDAGVMAQLGPANIDVALWFENHGPVRMGTTSAGLFPDNNLDEVVGSDGYSYGVKPTLTLNATRNIDLVAAADIPLRGEDLMFFPIEDLHPTRGVTWTGAVELRY